MRCDSGASDPLRLADIRSALLVSGSEIGRVRNLSLLDSLFARCMDFVKDGMDYFLVFVAK